MDIFHTNGRRPLIKALIFNCHYALQLRRKVFLVFVIYFLVKKSGNSLYLYSTFSEKLRELYAGHFTSLTREREQ